MFEPISNEAKDRLKKAGVILFKSVNTEAKTMVEMSVYDTCPYHIHYSVSTDELIHLFVCEIVVTRNFTMARNIRLPAKSDLIHDEPMLVAMSECFLNRLETWAKRLGKPWAMTDSCLPHYDIALNNAGFSPMRVGALASDDENKWHRGRKKVGVK